MIVLRSNAAVVLMIKIITGVNRKTTVGYPPPWRGRGGLLELRRFRNNDKCLHRKLKMPTDIQMNGLRRKERCHEN